MDEPTRTDKVLQHLDHVVTAHHKLTEKRQSHLDAFKKRHEDEKRKRERAATAAAAAKKQATP